MKWNIGYFRKVQTWQLANSKFCRPKPASLQGTCSISKFWKSFTWHPRRANWYKKLSQWFLDLQTNLLSFTNLPFINGVSKLLSVTPRWSFAPARWTPDQYKHEVRERRAWKQTCVAGHAWKLGLIASMEENLMDAWILLNRQGMQLDNFKCNFDQMHDQQVSSKFHKQLDTATALRQPTKNLFWLVVQFTPNFPLLKSNSQPNSTPKNPRHKFPHLPFAKMLPATRLELIHVIPPKLCTLDSPLKPGEIETPTLSKISCMT